MWKQWLPTRDSLLANKWLVRFVPAMVDPRLWKITSRSVSLGLAVGVFFGILIPVAQIPAAVAAAVWFRANVLFAAISTLVTNPITFAPVYVIGFKLGDLIMPSLLFEWLPTGFDFVVQMYIGLFILAAFIAPMVYFIARRIMAKRILNKRAFVLSAREPIKIDAL